MACKSVGNSERVERMLVLDILIDCRLILIEKMTLLAERHRAWFSFPGSTRKCTALEAPPRFELKTKRERSSGRQAEPAIQWVPGQSLGTGWWRSASSGE